MLVFYLFFRGEDVSVLLVLLDTTRLALSLEVRVIDVLGDLHVSEVQLGLRGDDEGLRNSSQRTVVNFVGTCNHSIITYRSLFIPLSL